MRERLQPPESAQPALRGDLAPEGSPAEAGPRTQRETLPLLRVVGQVATTYVVAEGPDGMYLIDQHAAHERVVFDRLKARTAEEAVQPLLEPVLVELDRTAAAVFEEHGANLERLGLHLEPFGDAACLVRAAPAGFGDGDIAGGLRAMLEKLGDERRVPVRPGGSDVACHSSVRAGMALSLEEMRQLIEDLGATASPRTCPHGRPTLVHVRQETLDRQFGR